MKPCTLAYTPEMQSEGEWKAFPAPGKRETNDGHTVMNSIREKEIFPKF